MKILSCASLLAGLVCLLLPSLHAQSVTPVIQEYQGKGEGKFTVTNNTLEPMVVVLEPKSFSIGPDGHGTFRELDPSIHVELSAMTLRLQPQQSTFVFYKASAEVLPAWFTIYSSFSSLRRSSDISVHVQLPHTVYLYQKQALRQTSIDVARTYYSKVRHKLVCEIRNTGSELGRVSEVRLAALHGASSTLSGFPLLPGAIRKFEVEWQGKTPPNSLSILFDHFTVKPQIALQEEPGLPDASASSASQDATGTPADAPTDSRR